ncbi:MAG: regulatory protein GemA [Paracoccus sp. (in: a-proteobacteria)]|uniref:regulatory protein GemA n=1 Tax=Paracoccus sp. TaxID=267 RepID=UPI0026DF806C|nr:regulatory protein GemA [Paracoccus sp. (in: a-proteobacteria)]MDO5631114.1 regulatory protein GemA [Paracoccus sp. (in: a-proteobacteria)]
MSALAAVQIKRRQLGLEDEDWRDVVERVTGQRSTRTLRPVQLHNLLDECDRLLGGRGPVSKPRRKPLGGRYAAKLQALWIAAWNLGLVATRDDKALIAFVRRQTGIDNPAWVLEPEDALKIIEALKAMTARRGVNWHFNKYDPAFLRAPGYQIALAQFRLVGPEATSFNFWAGEMSGKPVEVMTGPDWVMVMNHLGRQVRAAVRAGKITAGDAA